MGERCPAEKLQIWGTTTPDTSLFLLGDDFQEATGQHWLFRTYEMQIQLYLLPDPSLKTPAAL